jgi:imidazoleglycerol-phosphate dehydratase
MGAGGVDLTWGDGFFIVSPMRRTTVERITKETQIRLTLSLDGTGVRKISSPLPFFNHMLDTVVRHGLLDLELEAQGDVEVDAHHTIEDVGIVLGQAFKQALGDKQGIRRFGEATIPMDETLVTAAVDFGGRATFVYRADQLKTRWIGDFDCELAREFFGGFVSTALFKAFARSLRAAVAIDPREGGVPSTKGTLTA